MTKFDDLNFKNSTLASLVLSILLIAILVYNQVALNNTLPKDPVEIVLQQATPMTVSYAGEDSELKLRKGDTLRVLGFRNGELSYPPQLLVDTRDGQRGFISTIGLGYPFRIVTNDSINDVEVLSMRIKDKYPKVKVRYANGQEEEEGTSRLKVILPDSIGKYEYEGKGWYYMSKKKFERLYMSKPLPEASKLYRPYTYSIRTKDGWKVSFYQIKVFDKNEGKFLSASVTYNDSLMPVSYDLCRSYGNNGWVMKWLPLAEGIIDIDFFASIIQSSFYEPTIIGSDISLAGGNTSVTDWCLAGLWILMGLLWLFCVPMLPALVMGAAMQCRYTFYHLSDTALSWIIYAVTVVSGYIWLVLLLTYGTLWFIAIPMILTCVVGPAIAASPLDSRPHMRCEGCRRMWTIKFLERVWGETYEKWEVVTEKGDLLHQEHSSYKTWTETTYSNGTKTKSDEKTHHVTDSTYAIHHYNVLFRYHPFDDVYKCSGCGHLEKIHDHRKEELQREYLSSGTTTVTTET